MPLRKRRSTDVPRTLAEFARLAEPYDRAVDQLRIDLAGLPEPGIGTSEPAPFTTSVTGLVTLASCPLRYRWSEIDRLPRRPSPAARRGVELHRRIEMHNRGTVAFEDATPGFYDAVGDEASPRVPTPDSPARDLPHSVRSWSRRRSRW